MERNYTIKIDDILLFLLNEYHKIDASDAMAFFTDRVHEMGECEPNITNKSRPATIVSGSNNRTVQVRYSSRGRHNQYRDHGPSSDSKFYVLRGFFPGTSIPFKMITVYAAQTMDKNSQYTDFRPAHVKIVLGMKPHWTEMTSKNIDKYKEHVSEAILLDQPVMESQKIEYTQRKFKCMRPKGMPLYGKGAKND